jgi:TPR repeat protein
VESVWWYRKAAEQGNASGQNNLGWLYFDGSGVAQDYAEAVKWFRESAEQGDAWGQESLGLCYENGDGVPADVLQAYKWYQLSAEQGDESERQGLASWADVMSPSELKKAEALCREFRDTHPRKWRDATP